MFLAYIDETGEPGAYVGAEHPKFHTSAAFGYAGFVIPEAAVRDFGARFQHEKFVLFKTEIEALEHPGRWERKGARIFRPQTLESFPQQLRVFNGLVGYLKQRGGALFYYADEKPLGTPKQTGLDSALRESQAMAETLNRLARYAKGKDDHILVMIDQINEKTRIERLSGMYGHIFSRASDHPEMLRILEPPMHIDSKLSANIQFADWVAACVTRAIDYQLVKDSRHQWVTDGKLFSNLERAFTYESKLHLHNRSLSDIHHLRLFDRNRPLHPRPVGQLLEGSIDPDVARKMRGIAESGRRRSADR